MCRTLCFVLDKRQAHGFGNFALYMSYLTMDIIIVA